MFLWIFASFLTGCYAEEVHFKDIICPPRDTNVTLFYSIFKLDVEHPDDNDNPQCLADLHGFGVNVMEGFLDQCPMHYNLVHASDWPILGGHSKNHNVSNFIIMNMAVPQIADYTNYDVSQSAMVAPSVMVYMKGHDSGFSVLQ